MRAIKAILMLTLALPLTGHAQDEVYMKGGEVNEWKVIQVTPGEVQYGIPANPGVPYATARSNVLFLFNRLGNFLVVQGFNDADSNAQHFKDNFFNAASDAYGSQDRIITMNDDIITGKYTGVDGNKVTYTAGGKDGKIAASDIAVIIFMNGDHKLYCSVKKASQVLNAVQANFNNMAFGSAAVHKTGPAPPPPPSPGGTLTLSNDQKDSCAQEAITKVKDFGYYLTVLCNKSTSRDVANSTIDRALALFIDGDRIIEIAQKDGSKTQQKIKDYLNHLRFLSYDKVIIQWYNVQFVNQFRKGPDGNFYGEVEFEQKFTAISGDNSVKYSDVTRKKAEIVLKPFAMQVNGIQINQWHVLLGDIGVSQIKSS